MESRPSIVVVVAKLVGILVETAAMAIVVVVPETRRVVTITVFSEEESVRVETEITVKRSRASCVFPISSITVLKMRMSKLLHGNFLVPIYYNHI